MLTPQEYTKNQDYTLKVVKAIIKSKTEELLIGQRPENKILGSLWELPGGKVESSETLEAAIIREIKEEFSVYCSVNKEITQLQQTDQFYPDRQITFYLFECSITGAIQPNVHSNLLYINYAEFSSYDFVKADRKLIEKYFNSQII